MSGDKKKRASKAQGWEEAKDEFYQESYNIDADADVIERDSKKITTLLPSQQNRMSTVTIKKGKNGKNKSTARQRSISRTNYYATTTNPRRQSMVQENYIAMMPDLSENLSNERTTWEEIMKIKDLPISMSQKKEQKARLQSATKLRLQGYEQFKWQRRKMYERMHSHWNETYSKFEIWKKSLREIEGNFGTGVVSFFRFIKWLMYLNIVIFLLMFTFVVLPTLLSEILQNSAYLTMEKPILPCRNMSMVEECSNNYTRTISSRDIGILDVIQGTGAIENTYLFFGKYDCSIYTFPKYLYYYNLSFAYILVTIFIFILSLAAIVKSAAQAFKGRLVEGEGQFNQFCSLIFSGWDFCIYNEKSANMKHKALYNEIKYRLTTEKQNEEKILRSNESKIKIVFVRALVNVTVLLLLAGAGCLIYFAVKFQSDARKGDMNEIMAGGVLTLVLQYLPSLVIVGLNSTMPTIFGYLVRLEKYTAMFVIHITLMRTIFLRLASLVVLLISIYDVMPRNKDQDSCYQGVGKTTFCWETYAGQQFYRLILLDFVAHILTTFFVNFPRMLIGKHCKSKLAKLIGEQEFDLPKHVLDVVYTQTICWLGTYFSPILPGLVAIYLFFMFYVKKFACLVNSRNATKVYLASRAKFLFMSILLISFVVAITPVALSIAETKPSIACGPFRGEDIVWGIVITAFNTLPKSMKKVAFYFSTAAFAVPAFFILALFLYYFYALSEANKHMVMVLKNQLVLEGHDKQFLLDRLSAYIKQQEHNSGRKDSRNLTMNTDINSITESANPSH
ncbi:hypothetical protein RUM43_008799 [Polyplax serrata]|uniref:TMC domain-containing protein n=1 Tax=Polyplax serrata TaxID=468196 RepID=A0AAN8NUW8_POLSC